MKKYVKNFAKIAAPMMDLSKGKFEIMTWICDCHQSFEIFKIFDKNYGLEDFGSHERRANFMHKYE